MDGMLSQDEINALLNGISDEDTGDSPAEETMGAESEPAVSEFDTLTDVEKDAVGEISNISMGTAATTLYSLVNRKVTISTPIVSVATWENVIESYDRPCVFIQISYTVGLDGKNILILKEKDVKIITDLMMGGDGTNTDGVLDEIHLSAIGEAMNQMMGSSATSLSSMLNKKIDISTPQASLVDLNDNIDTSDIAPFLNGDFIKITFRMEIDELVDSEIMQLYPIAFAKDLYDSFALSMQAETEETPAAPAEAPAPAPAPQAAPVQQAAPPNMAMPQQQAAPQPMPMMQQMPPNMAMQQPYMMPPMQNVNVQPAQFQAFSNDMTFANGPENIDLIMDVPLDVTVELGRTHKSIQEILDFTPGTIIELNKIAGEPIDVIVNGKLVAKGEVVVIEESFGVRVTEIIH
ncbi:MAG: flagellar motor switch phosphatase FliY [Lachnospiraceae bacterium]|nr:flagellar motor switch phosphatase FliY [Lachnospiraceae bacterium]